MVDFCEWKWFQSGEGYYDGECGFHWVYPYYMWESDGLEHNDYNYCPKCGRKIKEVKGDYNA